MSLRLMLVTVGKTAVVGVVGAVATMVGLQAAAQEPTVFFSEFMAGNDNTLCDHYDHDPDWVEIHNPGSRMVDLEDWYITDTPETPDRWQIGPLKLEPGEYLVIFLSGKGVWVTEPVKDWSGKIYQGSTLHTGFRLTVEGEYLALHDPEGKLVDEIGFGGQERGVSLGRSKPFDEGEPLPYPTPGLPNDAPESPPSLCCSGHTNAIHTPVP